MKFNKNINIDGKSISKGAPTFVIAEAGVNHVWSTDITYIKIAGGMAYMAAIIDWHSKAVLSHRISNTMDVQLVMSVLNDALAKYPYPEIFNTDQGSQYTSEIHTQRLKNLGITISMDGRGRAVILPFLTTAKNRISVV